MKKVIVIALFIYPLLAWAQFDGIVGSEGCKAISCKDKRLIAWAESCSVVRGYQDVAKPQNGLVSYGVEANALGVVNDSDAANVISLGDGGTAIVSFASPIMDKEGADFVIFENALNDAFLELAFVEVSSDGIHYVRFPAASYTPATQQIGSFGSVEASRIHNLAGKYRIGWGTPFDLKELAGADNLDVNNINYVKIMDVIGCIDTNYASYDTAGRIINDPYPTDFASGGFDLAGVGVINNAFTTINEAESVACTVYPNPCKNSLIITGEASQITLFSILGQRIMEIAKGNEEVQINIDNLPSGFYVVSIHTENHGIKCIKISKQE